MQRIWASRQSVYLQEVLSSASKLLELPEITVLPEGFEGSLLEIIQKS